MKFNWEKCTFLSLVSKTKFRKWASNGLMENSIEKQKQRTFKEGYQIKCMAQTGCSMFY